MMNTSFWRGKKRYYFVVLYFADIFAFLLSIILASFILPVTWRDPFFLRLYLFSIVMLVVLYTNYSLYANKRNLFDVADFMHILYANSLTAFILCAFLFLFDPTDGMLFITIVLVLFLSTIFTTFGRLFLDGLISLARKRGFDTKNTIFFGDIDEDLIVKLKNKHFGYKLLLVTKNRKELEKRLSDADIVFVKTARIDEDLLTLITNNSHINWKILSSVLNLVIDPVAFDEFKDYPLINISNDNSTKTFSFVKRVMDIVFSGLALAFLFPFGLIVALLIKITMPGPIFFRQERLGKHLEPFNIYKLRSMKVNADGEKAKLKNEVKGLFKLKNDPRITPLGKLLRRTCIDELPQLINIFLGDMSLVGPRPHLEQELSHFEGWRRARFNVKPGLTGLWQVNGRHELNFDKAVLYDIYYVRHYSFLMDITIILKTIPAIILAKGRF